MMALPIRPGDPPAGLPHGTPLVAAHGITVTYGTGATSLQALKGVTVEVHPADVILLMGPSGSGKTTLLQVLGCVLRPTTGAVRLLGAPLDRVGTQKLAQLRLRHFGFVFQAANLFPTLRAWENVALALDLHGICGAAAERRSRALLDSVGLADRAHAFPWQLSGGEKQRVAVARALAGEPKVILADEPTAALDSHNAAAVMTLLRGIARRDGRAVVIVTHDRRLIASGDRIVQIEDGLLVGSGSSSSRHTQATLEVLS